MKRLKQALVWFWQRYHWFALGFWLLMLPVTYTTGLRESVAWTNFMSLYANIWISLEVVLNREKER